MLPSDFKPMLAGKITVPVGDLPFPYLTSPKLDGIRCIVSGGVAYSRALKPIPNKAVQALVAAHPRLEGMDGELMAGDPAHPNAMQNTTTVVMSHDKPADDVSFHVFDRVGGAADYGTRFVSLQSFFERVELPSWVKLVPHEWANDAEELLAQEIAALNAGYEGLMLRTPSGAYKHGRSGNNKNGDLLKLKRFEDAEAVVVGMTELMHNHNEAQTNELGRTKRSSAKAGKVAGGVMGNLVCRAEGFEETFEIGTGFTAAQRAEFFDEKFIGRTLTFKYQPHGVKDKPRCPVFKGWRLD